MSDLPFPCEILCEPPQFVACGKELYSVRIDGCTDFTELLATNFSKFKIYRSRKSGKIYVVSKDCCGDKKSHFKCEYDELKANIAQDTGICFEDCDPVQLVASKKHYQISIVGGRCKALYFYISSRDDCDSCHCSHKKHHDDECEKCQECGKCNGCNRCNDCGDCNRKKNPFHGLCLPKKLQRLFNPCLCYTQQVDSSKYRKCFRAPYTTVKQRYCDECPCEDL